MVYSFMYFDGPLVSSSTAVKLGGEEVYDLDTEAAKKRQVDISVLKYQLCIAHALPYSGLFS